MSMFYPEEISILVVEDNLADFRMVQEVLLDEGSQFSAFTYRFSHALYLRDAIALLSSQSYHVVLLDLNLPDSDGIETLSSVLPVARQTPVVIMTGLDDLEMALAAIRRGAQDYVVKGGLGNAALQRSVHYAFERNRAEAMSRSLYIEQERTQMLRDMISDLSHDLRTPLSVIGVSVYLFGRTQQIEYLDRISQQVNYLTNLLDAFIDLAKLDNQIEAVDFQTVNLKELLSSVALDYDALATYDTKELRFEHQCEDCNAKVDRVLFRRAVINIVSNSLKYTNTGGVVTIRLSVVKNEKQDGFLLEFEDTGVGIPEADLSHIFDRFYRSLSAESSNRSGTGLGLSIVKAICDIHHADITVTTSSGVGTLFSVYLPRDPENSGRDSENPQYVYRAMPVDGDS